MHQGEGRLAEILLGVNGTAGRIVCAPQLVPGPGQYVLAQDESDAPLPLPMFIYAASPGGFLASSRIPDGWEPGARLRMRGPYGRGFGLPVVARRVVLVCLHAAPEKTLPLISPALWQGASVTIVSPHIPDDLPAEVEAQPPTALTGALRWADYVAVESTREELGAIQSMAREGRGKAQILVACAMPCGGLAECGVCAVTDTLGWKMACRDGPVFDMDSLVVG